MAAQKPTTLAVVRQTTELGDFPSDPTRPLLQTPALKVATVPLANCAVVRALSGNAIVCIAGVPHLAGVPQVVCTGGGDGPITLQWTPTDKACDYVAQFAAAPDGGVAVHATPGAHRLIKWVRTKEKKPKPAAAASDAAPATQKTTMHEPNGAAHVKPKPATQAGEKNAALAVKKTAAGQKPKTHASGIALPKKPHEKTEQ